jgi:hypothetical protein
VRWRFLLLPCILLLYPGESEVLSPKQQDDSGPHILAGIQGKVHVKRRVWHNYALASLGTPVRYGDLLQVDGSAKVVCADLTLHVLASGVSDVPCVGGGPPFSFRGQLSEIPRGESASFPRVLSPRQTRLLSPQPMLRWTPVPGAITYNIEIRCDNMTEPLVRDISSMTEIQYPKSAASLKPGRECKLIVTVGDRRSDEEKPGPKLKPVFSVIEPKERAALVKQTKRIQELGLDPIATGLLIAHLYAANGLNAEGIERLEKLAPSSKEPVVLRLLGELYLAIGLVSKAEAAYGTALDLARTANDDEGQALAHERLAQIYKDSVRNLSLAGEHVRAAWTFWNSVGDQDKAGELDMLLKTLGKSTHDEATSIGRAMPAPKHTKTPR